MAREMILPLMTEDDALGRIIAWLQRPRQADSFASPSFGHDLYMPNLIADVLRELREADLRAAPQQGLISTTYDLMTNTAPFYDAAWALCRRGILRPGVSRSGFQTQSGEIAGAGFAVTAYGQRWLGEASGYEVLPSEYGRFAQLLAHHAERLGPGYHARSQEAVRCYQAHTYLACCAMSGAAAESILLALAIAKRGDEAEVLSIYRAAHGRSKVEKLLIGQQPMLLQHDFTNFMSLLKYWRDEAAHGMHTAIQEDEAFTALILLLRFAQVATARWEELTQL